MSAPPLLIVWHSRTGTARALAAAAKDGAGAAARSVRAEEASFDDFLAAHGYLFVGPENLGSLSGMMKEMFDRCYYPLLGRIEGRAYATIVAAGSDGEQAGKQIDRIVTGWRLKRIAEPVIVNMDAQTQEAILAHKTVPPERLAEVRELGEAFAEGLRQGVF